jgi:hypothetical protein
VIRVLPDRRPQGRGCCVPHETTRGPKDERALALKASAFIAAQYGHLPLHSNAAPTAVPKTYAFRAARHGLVVFVTYGLTAPSERARLRAAAALALVEIPGLEAVSLESYEAHAISGKARFSSRETVLRKAVASAIKFTTFRTAHV